MTCRDGLEQGTFRGQKVPFVIVISLNASHFVMVNTINKQRRINIFPSLKHIQQHSSRGRSEFLQSNSVASPLPSPSPVSLSNHSKLFCINKWPRIFRSLLESGRPITPPHGKYNPRLNYHNCLLFLPTATRVYWADSVKNRKYF